MTKKDAASRLLWIAGRIRDEMGGDENADLWAFFIETTAYDLDPTNPRHAENYLREPVVSVRTKLRRMIDHPQTPQPEREAALRALERLGAAS